MAITTFNKKNILLFFIMKQIFWLSGENLKLAIAEIKAVTGIKKYDIYDNKLLVATADNKNLQNLAYSHKIYKYIFESNFKELEKRVKIYPWERIYKKNFCVKINNLSGKKIKFNEKELGGLVWQKLEKKGKKPNVNLVNTNTKIELFFMKKRIICGLFLRETDKSYLERWPHKKPGFMPVSIIPKLAKACVNLAGVKKGIILDPFCGTGGILVEAGLMRHKLLGFDLSEKMLKIAEKNLRHYKVRGFKLKKQDSTKEFKEKFDAVVTDPPYGRNTRIEIKELEKLYKNFLNNLYGLIKRQKIILITPDFLNIKKLIKNKFKIQEKISYYIHKSLTRNIYILAKS